MARTFVRSALALTLLASASLAGCGQREEASDADKMDAALTDESNDPAMRGALEDNILVDPNLDGQSNRNSATGRTSTGVPSMAGAGRGGEQAARAEFAEKGLMSAPEPTRVSDRNCTDCQAKRGGMTLGAMAEAQNGKGTCDAKLTYDMGWAGRMPPEFTVYPKANVREAAGVDGGLCDIRVVNFVTQVGIKPIVDYYYTKARRGGYSAEYQVQGNEHVLGGTRGVDDGAYVVFLRRTEGGLTDVDIVANNGR